MARRNGRLSRAGLRAAGVLVVVLLVHAAVLEWFARYQVQPPSQLRKMADPMFTRVLVPQAPPPPAPSEPAPAPAKRSDRPAIAQVKPAPAPPPSVPEPTTPTTPTTVPTEPAPEAEPLAQEVPPPPAEEVAATPPPTAPEPAASDSTIPTAEDLERWPRDSRLGYTLSGQYRGGPLYGDAQVQWRREGPLYEVRLALDVSLAGSRVMTSQGVVTPQGLSPRVYEEAWRGRRRSVQLQDGQLLFGDGGNAPSPAGVQDTASQFVELGHRFATGRDTLEVGRSVEVWLARPGGVDLWTYDVVGSEMLKTPHHGEVEAFRLKPRPISKPRGNITAEIWFAPTLQYLPVRIRVSTGQEDFVELMVETIEQR